MGDQVVAVAEVGKVNEMIDTLKLVNLESNRLYLRNAKDSDLDELWELLNLDSTLQYNCMEKVSKQEVMTYIHNCQLKQQEFFLEHKQSGRLVGVISLERDSLRYGVRSLNISYYLHPNYMRQGLMSEAMREVIVYLFEVVNLDCITARVFTPNVASNALMRSLGFELEGTLKHAVRGYKGIVYDDNLYVLMNHKR